MAAIHQTRGSALDDKAIRLWLETASRNEILSIIVRGVLRALPLVPDHVASRLALISAIFRLSSTALFSVKYQRRFPKKQIWHACDIIDEITGTAVAPSAQAASAIGSVLFGGGAEPARMAAKAIEYLLSFDRSEASSRARRDSLDAISSDIRAVKSGLPPEKLVLTPLWPTSVPKWLDKIWDGLSADLRKRGAHWDVWINWYHKLLVDSPAATSSGRSWDEAFVDVRRASPLPWDEGPKAVNEKIASRLAVLVARPKTSSPLGLHPTSGKQTLDQRPSNYRFDWRQDLIEATPVTEPPFDLLLASTIAQEILAKAQEALLRLSGNNADDIVQRAVERVAELIERPVVQIPEGVLLSRSNTLAAHARAYMDPGNERERAIRATLDDLSTSLESLVDCYPGVRAINASRIALGMQAEHASQVEAELTKVADLARDSQAIAYSAREALESGKGEIDDLNKKIEDETNLAIAANYIKARGEAVAARLSDAVNFMSATLQQGALELKGLSGDTWREIRKQLPRVAARGVAKAAEEAIGETVSALIKLPIIGLAYLIAGPLERFSVDVNRNSKGVPKGAQIRFGLL